MFEIGFPELVLIAIVGLLVIGPERLPETLRTLGLWFGRMRRSFINVKAEIEKEIGMDEVRRQLHNEAIMEEMKRIESEVKGTADAARRSLGEGANAAGNDVSSNPPPIIDPNPQGSVSDLLAAQGGEPVSSGVDRSHADADGGRDHSDAADDHGDDRDHTDASDGNSDDRHHTDAADQPDHPDAEAEPAPVKDAVKGT